MKEFRSHFCYKITLCALPFSTIAYTLDTDPIAYKLENSKALIYSDKDTYTINFNNVSIIELIRFASKITNLNFVFEESELQFTVTVVSEEPVSAKNVMSVLIQVLRVHDLNLVEQDKNILITSSKRVHQIPPIISQDSPFSKIEPAALVTRVFRIKNANITTVASILRPMVSDAALIEMSPETKQLIVTDIAANIEQISTLLSSLDAPHSPLEIDSYNARKLPLDQLILLTQQIISPFVESNPIIFVPQLESHTVYIVSTPYLIEKAMEIMEDLDVSSEAGLFAKPGLRKVFLYKVKNRTVSELKKELEQVSSELKQTGSSALASAIFGVQVLRDSNSLLFVIDDQSIAKLQDILAKLDTPILTKTGNSSFFIYKIEHAEESQIANSLHQMLEHLQASPHPDSDLVDVIKSMKWIKETNSLVFTGTRPALRQIETILPTFDIAPHEAHPNKKTPPKSNYFVYKPVYRQPEDLEKALKDMSHALKTGGLIDKSFLAAVATMQWVESTKSLVFTGDPDSIEKIQTLLVSLDNNEGYPAGASSFSIYKPKYVPAEEIQAALVDLAFDLKESGLNDPKLLKTLSSVRYVAATKSFVFAADQETLTKVQSLLDSIDIANASGSIQHVGNVTFFVYNIQNTNATQLIASLKNFAAQLEKSTLPDKSLAETLEKVRWIKETNSLLFTGTEQTLERVQQLAQNFDLSKGGKPQIPNERKASTFTTYTPKFVNGDDLIEILQEFMNNLISAGVSDTSLFDAINNLKWIPKTSILLISGEPTAIQRIEGLLQKFDIPGQSTANPAIESIENTSFLVYKLQFHGGDDIQIALKQVVASLAKSSGESSALSDAVASLQWIKVTNSLLSTGQEGVLIKLKELIQNLDTPLKQVFIEVLVIETRLSNAQNFGLQWGSKMQYLDKAAVGFGNFPVAVPPPTQFGGNLQTVNATTTPKSTMIPFTNGFDLGVIGDIIMHKGKSFISLGSLVNALQTDVDTTIVMNPKIITQDNRQSNIFVGQNIPFTGAIVTNSSNNTVTTSNVEYRDIGVNLTITPILGDNDMVTLDIVHDITEVVNPVANVNNAQLTGIQTSHTHMDTRVHVPNNHFVVLSGMIQNIKHRVKTGLPCLGGLPVIGVFFSENDRDLAKSNVIIFVRPQIINSYDEYKKVTEHQEWLYKDSASLPILKEEFDEGLDLVKLPENE
ncbi:secretin N-terminal domain-containing protein [Candidatus Rhabdochlamydia sp. T3358]|uniref:secretin N-terminal domain-containing protein n=1 Tax=Candidatus Rhabdochlamydia sp. T3358 TaxID=2099795 RepID=UPI0010B957E6|nr:secretin N-terminal domain-containing protein [Candidatus Rhabdochlamydia sp. T3358]VHO04195.1 Putative type II secretion system protein D precursor [Candidatus Rhabdochlamydia sp. T3358]